MRPLEVTDFQKLFEALPGAFLVLDPDYVIVDASDVYLDKAGVERDDIIGRGVFDVFPDNPTREEADGIRNLTASLRRVERTLQADTMPVQRYDIVDPRSGTYEFQTRWWSPVNSPVLDHDGQLEYIIHQVEDVTDFVLSTKRPGVDSRDAKLRAEILRRSAALGETNKKLRAAGEAKNEFLSRMSHELRTPLTAINGFSELLALSDLDDQRQRWVASIRRAGSLLLDLVNEVLDISRIEGGRLGLSIEPIPLEPVIVEAIEMMRPLANTGHLQIEYDGSLNGAHVDADRQRLKQVFINLISNAIKYNQPGGRVSIGAHADDEFSVVTVTDTGRGIAPEDFDRLFTPFDRLGAASSGIEGTGLGLALSRSLVELMNGSLTAESELGMGTTFTVRLNSCDPVTATATTDDYENTMRVREYDRKIKVLYIEDVVANVQLVSEVLKRRPSVTVIPTMLGGLGIDLAKEHDPDVILLDLHLPDIDGIDVLRTIRSDPEHSETPVVILTADATGAKSDELTQLDVLDFLTKPIAFDKLLTAIDRSVDLPH